MDKPNHPAQDDAGEEKPVPTAAPRRRYGRRMGDSGTGETRPVVWMITFTDVMGLMLTFFVMLFAMAKPAPEKWDEVSSSLMNGFGRIQGPVFERGPVDDINLARIDFDRALDISYLNVLLEQAVNGNEFLKAARLIRQPGRLIVSLPQDLLFPPSDAAVTDKGARALYALGGMLSRIKNRIQIVGHADPRPVQGDGGSKFASNWDLSLARAASVAGVLNSVGYEYDIDIVGLASGRYDDLSGIADEEKRMELARRVDIVLLDHDGRHKNGSFEPVSP